MWLEFGRRPSSPRVQFTRAVYGASGSETGRSAIDHEYELLRMESKVSRYGLRPETRYRRSHWVTSSHRAATYEIALTIAVQCPVREHVSTHQPHIYLPLPE